MTIAKFIIHRAGPPLEYLVTDRGWMTPNALTTRMMNMDYPITSDYLQPYPGFAALIDADKDFGQYDWVRRIEIVLSDDVKKLLARPQKIGVVN